MQTRITATHIDLPFDCLYPEGVRIFVVTNHFYTKSLSVFASESSDEQLDWHEETSVNRYLEWDGEDNQLAPLEKIARRSGLLTYRGETRGYSQRDWADVLITCSSGSDYDLDPKEIFQDFERWLWGDVWEVTKEALHTYVDTEDPDSTHSHYEYEDTYGTFLSDTYDLETKYFPNQEINYKY